MLFTRESSRLLYNSLDWFNMTIIGIINSPALFVVRRRRESKAGITFKLKEGRGGTMQHQNRFYTRETIRE